METITEKNYTEELEKLINGEARLTALEKIKEEYTDRLVRHENNIWIYNWTINKVTKEVEGLDKKKEEDKSRIASLESKQQSIEAQKLETFAAIEATIAALNNVVETINTLKK